MNSTALKQTGRVLNRSRHALERLQNKQVPMPIDEGAAAACRVLSSLYSFLLADGHVPPLTGIAPAGLRALPAR